VDNRGVWTTQVTHTAVEKPGCGQAGGPAPHRGAGPGLRNDAGQPVEAGAELDDEDEELDDVELVEAAGAEVEAAGAEAVDEVEEPTELLDDERLSVR
jgi:hypothetical protein